MVFERLHRPTVSCLPVDRRCAADLVARLVSSPLGLEVEEGQSEEAGLHLGGQLAGETKLLVWVEVVELLEDDLVQVFG